MRRGFAGLLVVLGAEFPFLLGGAFIEASMLKHLPERKSKFPFLLGGAFIEASSWRRGISVRSG